MAGVERSATEMWFKTELGYAVMGIRSNESGIGGATRAGIESNELSRSPDREGRGVELGAAANWSTLERSERFGNDVCRGTQIHVGDRTAACMRFEVAD